MDLKNCLEEYGNITKDLIEQTKQGEELEDLLNKREEVIGTISDLHFNKDEFQCLVIDYKIFELEEELKKQIEIQKKQIKNKMETIRQTSIARIKYDNMQFKPTLFNKKI